MNPSEHTRRREVDSLTDHRLDKLEDIVEKLTENQVILTRIELAGQENSRALSEVKERMNYHGRALDGMAREVENSKTKLTELPDISEYSALVEKVKMHDRAIVGTISMLLLWIISRVLGIITLP